MDVLELPRPVINFLRTMAKEGCRYVLSWDIFGGTDAVTLTLTWKATDDQSQLLISKSPQQQIYDDLHIRHNDSILTPRRSRRDDNISIPSVFRSPRGKSSDENNRTSIRQSTCHQLQASSLERSSIINRPKKESDPIYANLPNVKYVTNSLSSNASTTNNNSPLLSAAHAHYRQAKQENETPILRRARPLTSVMSETSPTLRQKNSIATRNNDDDDDTLDPWVKRFECSLGDNTNEQTQQCENNIDKTESTSGKVKFKRKPDYF